MEIFYRMAFMAALLATLTGCANVNTLARSTSTPMAGGKSKAIHLDAQQRLVVFTAMKYCAEPSPDALAAYAAALGLSGSKLPSDSLSASGGLNSVAGSIGLRTQSITLMRDTLYRNCEAALNGYLSHEQVAVLMSRSQDLTAVILAIEQLTGAVAAPPITLSTGGSSSSASTLMANTEALKAAEEQLAKTKKERDEAEQKKNNLQTALDQRKAEAAKARQAATADASKEAEAKEKENLRDLAQKDYDAANELFEQADINYKLQQDTTDRIKALRDSSVNTASASVSGNASTGSVTIYSSRLTDTQQLATAVDKMIRRYLHKDYFADACISTLLRPIETGKEEASEENSIRTRPAPSNDATSKSTARTEANQRALDYVCLRYFAQFKPHQSNDDDENEEKPRGSTSAPDAGSSAAAINSFNVYRNQTADGVKEILNEGKATRPSIPNK